MASIGWSIPTLGIIPAIEVALLEGVTATEVTTENAWAEVTPVSGLYTKEASVLGLFTKEARLSGVWTKET